MDHKITVLPLRPSKPKLNIIDLPTEILDAIYRLLCHHCQVEHVVLAKSWDLQDDLGPFADQRAIAQFSQCCRRLRDVAQPVLFHWYHGDEDEIDDVQTSRLGSFVGAILRRPTLAAATRALVFQPRDMVARRVRFRGRRPGRPRAAAAHRLGAAHWQVHAEAARLLG